MARSGLKRRNWLQVLIIFIFFPVKAAQDEDGSTWRQVIVVVILNMVTFLQGASLTTHAISVSQLMMNGTIMSEEWPKDFRPTNFDEKLIGKMSYARQKKRLIIISLTAQSWLLGHLVSSLIWNPVAELLGRKASVILDTLIFGIGFGIYAIGESSLYLCIGRFLMGFPLVNTVSLDQVDESL